MSGLNPALEKEWDDVQKQLLNAGYDPEDVDLARFTTTNFAYQHFMLTDNILNCQDCSLFNQCSGPVTGAGNNRSPIMMVGEAPGELEDQYGLPMIGATGQLLTLVMTKLGVDRNVTYMTNAVKCRPPESRDPKAEEMDACMHHLRSEIKVVDPSVIITLGNIPMRVIRGDRKLAITKERGKWYKVKNWKKDVYIIHTYHPSYILRLKGDALLQAKREFWEDLSSAFSKAQEMNPGFNLKGSLGGVI